MRPAIALLLALALAAQSQIARADPPECTDAAPSDAEVTRRLRWLEARIDQHEPDMRHWYSAFLGLHIPLIGVQLVLAFATPEDERRPDFIVNTISGVLGLTTLLISNPPLMGAGDFYRRLADDTPAARYVRLRAVEGRVRSAADSVAFVQSPLSVAASLLYVEAASLTLLFLERPQGALLHAIGATIIGTSRLLLHPTGIWHVWRSYQARHADAGCALDEASVELSRYAHGVRASVTPGVPAPGAFGASLFLAF